MRTPGDDYGLVIGGLDWQTGLLALLAGLMATVIGDEVVFDGNPPPVTVQNLNVPVEGFPLVQNNAANPIDGGIQIGADDPTGAAANNVLPAGAIPNVWADLLQGCNQPGR